MWCDGVKYKKPTALPANEYIGNLMEWVENLVNDATLFPISVGKCVNLWNCNCGGLGSGIISPKLL